MGTIILAWPAHVDRIAPLASGRRPPFPNRLLRQRVTQVEPFRRLREHLIGQDDGGGPIFIRQKKGEFRHVYRFLDRRRSEGEAPIVAGASTPSCQVIISLGRGQIAEPWPASHDV